MYITIIRWIAYVLGSLLFFFWGAFFLAHLIEWFINPLFRGEKMPSISIWVQNLFHLFMLLGFIIAFKYELFGGLLIVASAAVFFSLAKTSLSHLYFAVTIIPALLYIFCWWKSRL